MKIEAGYFFRSRRRITMKEKGFRSLFLGERAQRWPLVGIMAELQKKSRRKFGFPNSPGAGVEAWHGKPRDGHQRRREFL